MTQKELADRTGITKKTVQEIVQGRASLSAHTAVALEKVLGIKATFWLNLQAGYEADLARIEAQRRMQKEIDLAKRFPYATMAKQGMVAEKKQWEERIELLLRFFAVASLEKVELTLQAAFRRKKNPDVSPYALATWLRQGEILGSKTETAPFSRDRLRSELPALLALSRLPLVEAKKEAVRICAECGVAVVLVPHLPKTYVNGATKWLSREKALVILSLRGSYGDIIWFSLVHELGHILKGHSKKDTFIDFANDRDRDEKETEADDFASEQLIPSLALRFFRDKGDFSPQAIGEFAEKLERSPGIVAGRLAHLGHINWNSAAQFREIVTPYMRSVLITPTTHTAPKGEKNPLGLCVEQCSRTEGDLVGSPYIATGSTMTTIPSASR